MTTASEEATTQAETPHPSDGRSRLATRWGKRAGIAVFLFFFLKGLAWLIVPAVLAVWAMW